MGYVPVITEVAAGSVADAGLVGTVLKPGQHGNPFTTTGLLLERWMATWLAMGAPDALTLVLPRIEHNDLVQVLSVWNSLLSMPVFRAELAHIRQTFSPEHFERQIGNLHVRILFMVLMHKMIRRDILQAHTLTTNRSALPYFVQQDYHLAYEIQISGKIHPFLRPGFLMNPQWLSRRSRWSSTALHTMMCTLNRIGTWSIEKPWILQACKVYGTMEQVFYTRVPIGHLSTAPSTMERHGLYADPSITMLLSDAALNLVTLTRHQGTWAMFARGNPGNFDILFRDGGLRDFTQWRSWQVVPTDEPKHVELYNEPLYSQKLPSTKKSSAFSTIREVHFEMYKRWLAMTKSAPVQQQDDYVYDAAFQPLETFMSQLFTEVFDWNTFSMDDNVVGDFKTHAGVILSQLPVVPNPHFNLIARFSALQMGRVVEFV